ncbi:MAG: D-tyrosyl-tRNA(Tyr) deacylase [Spirochaetia bacterium]|nr:D-tyrosyl-tRNA(Tyr) deacylase [Spirochaetia bacterium]MBP5739530.1 D-tyrosyl-tRNA(Tyr) deacylase [Spirochaetia bacterium]
MRAVVQRVSDARVQVGEELIGAIDLGLLVYLGVHKDDTDKDFDYILDKVINLRIFSDDEGKMNLSLLDTGGEILVVSQFTLFGDARRGRRPSYGDAAGNEKGNLYYQRFLHGLKEKGIKTASGQFGAEMQVSYTNDGPVTILLDSFKDF